MENFINNTEEEQLVDLFDKQDSYAETQVFKRRKIAATGAISHKQDALLHHYLENMPAADMYEWSYMHKETVCQSKGFFIIKI